MKPLPLYPGSTPCIGSGLCCRTGVCPFGTWDAAKHQCVELLDHPDGSTSCRRYEEILALPQPQWVLAPAFGAGCCMPLFNTARKALLDKYRARERRTCWYCHCEFQPEGSSVMCADCQKAGQP